MRRRRPPEDALRQRHGLAGLAEHVGEKLIANLATLTIHSGFGSSGNAPARVAGERRGREGVLRLIGAGRGEASNVHLSAQSVGPSPAGRVPRELRLAAPHSVRRLGDS